MARSERLPCDGVVDLPRRQGDCAAIAPIRRARWLLPSTGVDGGDRVASRASAGPSSSASVHSPPASPPTSSLAAELRRHYLFLPPQAIGRRWRRKGRGQWQCMHLQAAIGMIRPRKRSQSRTSHMHRTKVTVHLQRPRSAERSSPGGRPSRPLPRRPSPSSLNLQPPLVPPCPPATSPNIQLEQQSPR